MNDTLNLILVFIAGLGLGTLFFGGLWLTVQKAASSAKPGLLIFASFILRIAITMTGFYFVGSGNWQRLLIVLSGFIIARFIIIQLTKSIASKQPVLKKEVGNET